MERTPLEALCSERGLRLTLNRRKVLRVMGNSPDHPDAREVHKRVNALGEEVGLTAVYRALSDLTDVKIFRRLTFDEGRARYELSAQSTHQHLVDVGTGEIVEVTDSAMATLAMKVARSLGYQLVDYKLTLRVEKWPVAALSTPVADGLGQGVKFLLIVAGVGWRQSASSRLRGRAVRCELRP